MNRLRNRQSVVSGGDDARPPKPWGLRVTTWIYYGVLLAVVAYGLYYVGSRILSFKAPGLVTTSTTPVAPTQGGRVALLPYGPGDTVRVDSLLARVDPERACGGVDSTRVSNLAADARLARARRAILADRIAERRERLASLTERTPLELDMDLRRARDQIEAELRDLSDDHRLLSAEIRILEDAVQTGGAVRVINDPGCAPNFIYAPFDAVVHVIHEDVFTVVDEGQAVLSLKALDPPVRVMAYADPDLLPSLFEGKEVWVRFPDDTRGRGVIEAMHAAAEAFALLDVADYRLQDSDVVLEVGPLDPADADTWRGFDRLPVEIRGRRRGR